MNESFFLFDSLVRKVWIEENSRTIVTVTGSHRNFCMFGAINIEGKQLFRKYNGFNESTFYEYMKQVHYKFPKCYLFLDKTTPHYKSQKVKQYFNKHKDSMTPIRLPTASPEFMGPEECWNISKNDLLVITYYSSFTNFKMKIGQYFRGKCFNMNIRNYLIGMRS
jgi:DDE superfamily endonuclease